jgi:hypothetical protein
MNGIGAGGFHEFKQSCQCRSTADYQTRPGMAQILLKFFERLMQPPARSGAGFPRSLLLGRPDKNGNDWAAMSQCGAQCGIVSEAQVNAKPQNDGGQIHRKSLSANVSALKEETKKHKRRHPG